MREVPISRLVLDFNLYPRPDVDSQHVAYLAEAIRAGSELPPIVIDAASKRVIDGFHRLHAHKRVNGPDSKIKVLEKTYASEGEMFIDAVRYNAAHGRTLSRYDRVHCILKAEEFKLEVERVADALHLTVETIGQLRVERVGKLRVAGVPEVPLKQTIRHMAGKTLTKGQQDANEKLSGMNQMFYVNQIITLIENDLLDKANEQLMEKLQKLHELLDDVLAKV